PPPSQAAAGRSLPRLTPVTASPQGGDAVTGVFALPRSGATNPTSRTPPAGGRSGGYACPWPGTAWFGPASSSALARRTGATWAGAGGAGGAGAAGGLAGWPVAAAGGSGRHDGSTIASGGRPSASSSR